MATKALSDAGRGVFAMAGADLRAVLQDVVTADLAPLAPRRAVYAALLTPQGKYLFDFFLLDGAPFGRDGEVLVDVAADRAADLARRLRMYCVRRDARLVGDTGLGVGLLWSDDAGTPPPAPDGAVALADPRHPALGLRVYAADPAAALAGATPAGTQDYAARRVALGVPETGVELVAEDTFPLEAGLDRLGAVDFRKGCYVGQEVTARMRHKTTLKKRLVRVAVEGAAAPGTPIETAEGKPAGTLYSQAGGTALAHLRLDRATGPLTAGDARVTGVLDEA
ncbi:MAG: YgfZ/GcvT domain-containing protein [Paracoccaceae bacterium]